MPDEFGRISGAWAGGRQSPLRHDDAMWCDARAVPSLLECLAQRTAERTAAPEGARISRQESIESLAEEPDDAPTTLMAQFAQVVQRQREKLGEVFEFIRGAVDDARMRKAQEEGSQKSGWRDSSPSTSSCTLGASPSRCRSSGRPGGGRRTNRPTGLGCANGRGRRRGARQRTARLRPPSLRAPRLPSRNRRSRTTLSLPSSAAAWCRRCRLHGRSRQHQLVPQRRSALCQNRGSLHHPATRPRRKRRRRRCYPTAEMATSSPPARYRLCERGKAAHSKSSATLSTRRAARRSEKASRKASTVHAAAAEAEAAETLVRECVSERATEVGAWLGGASTRAFGTR